MIYHFIPTFFDTTHFLECKIVSFQIPEMGLELNGDYFKVGKPYPNKQYHVASLKSKRKHLVGFCIEAPFTKAFTTITKWAVKIKDSNKEPVIIEHQINYTIKDEDFPLFSEYRNLQSAWGFVQKNFDARTTTDEMKGFKPIMLFSMTPIMETLEYSCLPRKKDGNNTVTLENYETQLQSIDMPEEAHQVYRMIKKFVQDFSVPTVSPELYNLVTDESTSRKYPRLEDALVI